MRPYQVLRKASVKIVDEAALAALTEQARPAIPFTEVDVLIPVGTFEAGGDAQAIKAAAVKEIDSGALDGVEKADYVAVTGTSFHELTITINRAPQLGIAR